MQHKIQLIPCFFLFLADEIYILSAQSIFMFTEKQVFAIIAENEALQIQVEDLEQVLEDTRNDILNIRSLAISSAELQSKMDSRLYEIESLQELLDLKDMQASAAREREEILQNDLMAAARENQRATQLERTNAFAQTQINDIEYQLGELQESSDNLVIATRRIAELESLLEMSNQDNKRLVDKCGRLDLALRQYITH